MALTATGAQGVYTGEYWMVVGVWSVVAPFVGAMMNYYFGPRRSDTE